MKIVCLLSLFLTLTFSSIYSKEADLSIEDLLNEKISTASKYEQRTSEAPASIAIITADDIESFHYRNLAEVLNRISGFFVRDDRNYTYLGARGFENPSSYGNKILLLLDGHTMNDNVYGGTYYGNDFGIDMNLIERIEILKGPGSSVYGTGAVLAVVNVVTKKIKDLDNIRISADAGSNKTYLAKINISDVVSDDFAYLLSFNHGISEGEDIVFPEFADINDGKSESLDGEKFFGIYSKLRLFDGYTVNFYFNKREKEIPTAPWDIIFNHSDSRTTDERIFGELKHSIDFSESTNLNTRLYMDYYSYSGKYPILEENSDTIITSDGNIGRWVGLESRLIWNISESNIFTFGFEAQHSYRSDYSIFNSEDDNSRHNYPYSLFSVYAQDSWQILRDLSFTLGLRSDYYTKQGTYLSPRAALVFNPFEYSAFKIIYGNAFRSPNTYELYYFDPRTAKNNKNLDAENINSFELNYEQRILDDFLLNTSVYYYKMQDLIEETIDPIDSLTIFKNKAEVAAIGFEIDAKYKLNNTLTTYFYFNYSEVYNNKIGGERFANYPPLKINLGAAYSPLSFLTLSYEFAFERGRKSIKGVSIDDFSLSNISIMLDPANITENGNSMLNYFNLNIKINNIFDKKYYMPASWEHKQDKIIQLGRSIILQMNVKI